MAPSMNSENYGKTTPEKMKEACRQIYLEEYVHKPDGSKIFLTTTDGIKVSFSAEQFEHAFSKADDNTGVRRFDFIRARKVRWIKQIINEQCDGLKVLKVDVEKNGINQRVYYLPERFYLVVLNWDETQTPRSLCFETAYYVDFLNKRRQLRKLFSL